MKVLIKFIFNLAFAIVFIYFLSNPLGGDVPFALGKMLSPFTGFWQNAESLKQKKDVALKIDGLQDEVNIYYDQRMVPHIKANNQIDVYAAQGYVMAQNRLWQMDFISRASAGRISEILGEKAISYDKKQRNMGFLHSAQQSVTLLQKNIGLKQILEAYTTGVNSYIHQLPKKAHPIEYKLMNYEPEPWVPVKTALLLKYMGNILASGAEDIPNTKALQHFGLDTFNYLYPNFPIDEAPIIPASVPFDFEAEDASTEDEDLSFAQQLPLAHAPHKVNPYQGYGSNNWAVSPAKSVTGHTILCNDPHLELGLPSIWYEVHLTAPGLNCYGVTLPGSPGIIIGFNDSIAWGVTNAERDVKDWYAIKFKNNEQNQYWLDSQWVDVTNRTEKIVVKHGEDLNHTVKSTIFGPIINGRSLKWMNHVPGYELQTFLQLNTAKNYADYRKAIAHFGCPAQNFLFASKQDIAITQQGSFPLVKSNQIKFIQDGTKSVNNWNEFISKDENPHAKNPEEGYLFSANQHPTNATYPHNYHGYWEYYRNRRARQLLSKKNKHSVSDLKGYQLDNFNLQAAESLPLMLDALDSLKPNENQQLALDILKQWQYEHQAKQVAPTLWATWFYLLKNAIWDEIYSKNLPPPTDYRTVLLIKEPDNSYFMDVKSTAEIETFEQLCLQTFNYTLDSLNFSENNLKHLQWGKTKETGFSHLAKLPAFSVPYIEVGGHGSALNAMSATWGPSWRMVVEMGDEVNAMVIYPGGQSGNPGSAFYDNTINDWGEGKYHKVTLTNQPENLKEKVYTLTLTPP